MTEKNNANGAGLADLEAVLERFGSDRTRWPAPVRRSFAGLLAASGEAQARLREARALDRLLDLMPEPAVETRALADRIVTTALAERAAGTRAGRPALWGKAVGLPRRVGIGRSQWQIAAALAASLFVGAFSGLSGALDSSVGSLVAGASSETDRDLDPGRIALDNDSISMFEEGAL
jgi:hypothetical protein